MQVHQTHSNVFEVSDGPIFVGKVWAEGSDIERWYWAISGDGQGTEMSAFLSGALSQAEPEAAKFIVSGFIANKCLERRSRAA